ncbi:MAG: sulfur carrier protein ThiS [Thermonema sp.]|uniref:sulfur carrier protein ThiS n=1 Tax=Thermonema TaxID=28194 RepID=UPI0008FFD6AE|nr:MULTISPECIES: sulfur carrier protein ThiS [Thermonema]GIV40480.1 MAG: sulfur carrier protein ThiS [Thermonema sp.]
MQQIRIQVNREERSIPPQTTLTALLDLLGIEQHRGIALAVNEQVVPKSKWAEHILQENDRITLIRATQGG